MILNEKRLRLPTSSPKANKFLESFPAWISCQFFDQGYGGDWVGERLGCSWSVIKQKAKPKKFFRKILSSFERKKNQSRLFTRANPLVAPKTVHFAPKRNARYTPRFSFPTLLRFLPLTSKSVRTVGVQARAITKFSRIHSSQFSLAMGLHARHNSAKKVLILQ